MTIWQTPDAGKGPPLTNAAYTRKCAVEYAAEGARTDTDWQEIQSNLLNRYPYAMLFDGMTEEQVYDETMAIIRAGEEIAYAEADYTDFDGVEEG